jgi:hypothetical protein
LSSDGGLLFIREIELKRGSPHRLAGCFTDHRFQPLVDHSVEELVNQRVQSLALGYEDLNDQDRLRHDPLCALMAGKEDVLGKDRMGEASKGKALAAHSTLNRMELGALGGNGHHLLKIIDELNSSSFEPLVTLAKTLHSWREPLAAMWRFTKNNGITEGFHRKMKLIQRRAYGFRNFQNYRLRVITQCG